MSVLRGALLMLLLLPLAAACTTDDDEGDETPEPTPSATATSPASPPSGEEGPATISPETDGEDLPPATIAPDFASTISDGICAATVPEDWALTGGGAGQTPSGARFELFGNHLRSDDEWQASVDLLLAQAESRQGAVEQGESFVRVTYPNDRGMVYRARFPDRYCDFSVTSLTRPIPAEERAYWDAIIETLAPAS